MSSKLDEPRATPGPRSSSLRFAAGLCALLALPTMRCSGHGSSRVAGPMAPRFHAHRLAMDPAGKIEPWGDADGAFMRVAGLAWWGLEHMPPQPNGLPVWYSYSRFDPQTFEGIAWPHNPASLNATLVESALGWYAYSGDATVIDVVQRALDYELAHGTTPSDWTWGNVPFASADPGATEYRGADDDWCEHSGRGDGVGVIEPDKLGELGYAYLRFFELTHDAKYRDAALASASALAAHVRMGDESHSPWPFRVHGDTDEAREEYCANVIAPITLFDELDHLGLATPEMKRARDVAWAWMMAFPMQNDAWTQFFEDIPIQDTFRDNPNQYAPMQTARYLMLHPELDPEWRAHVAHLTAFVAKTFAVDNDLGEHGAQVGAEVMSEQMQDMAKMASHTARYGAVNALWAERTGDAAAKEKARKSLSWATYMCDPRGVVMVGFDLVEGWWFIDGYGDYIRHFITAVGAMPEWAPSQEDHLLRTTSLVRAVTYAKKKISWSTADEHAVDVLRVRAKPLKVVAGNAALHLRDDLDQAGYRLEALPNGGYALRVRHEARDVTVYLGGGAGGD